MTRDCTTCKYGFVDERLGFPMCHHPKRFSEDCVDFNMHEEVEEPKKATGIEEEKLPDGLEEEIATWIPAHISGGDNEVWKDIKNVVTEWAGIVARHFYELGQCSSGNALKIKGWVAREIDGSLWLFNEKPKKREHKDGGEAWFGFGFFPLENLYPELSCDDEPVEVELTIKKI